MAESDLNFKVGELTGQVAAIQVGMKSQSKTLECIQNMMLERNENEENKAEGQALYKETVIEKLTTIEGKLLNFEKYQETCDKDRTEIAKAALARDEKYNSRFVAIEITQSFRRGSIGMLSAIIFGLGSVSTIIVEKWDVFKTIIHEYTK